MEYGVWSMEYGAWCLNKAMMLLAIPQYRTWTTHTGLFEYPFNQAALTWLAQPVENQRLKRKTPRGLRRGVF